MLFTEVIHEAGVPAGVFNLVNGDGPTVGEAMSCHPGIDMMSFTGSTRGGIAVAKASANSVKRVCQELGGKSPNIILDDENFRGSVGYDTWINIGDSTFNLNCNWVPQKPNEGAIKIIELIDGVFTNLYYKQIEGCNHPLPLKNSDDSIQIVFPGHDEGKISAGMSPSAPSYVFSTQTKEFTDMEIVLEAHGQGIFCCS